MGRARKHILAPSAGHWHQRDAGRWNYVEGRRLVRHSALSRVRLPIVVFCQFFRWRDDTISKKGPCEVWAWGAEILTQRLLSLSHVRKRATLAWSEQSPRRLPCVTS